MPFWARSGQTWVLFAQSWAVQDQLALDDDEEKAVELNREMVAGQERVVWNPALSIPAKEFEFTDPEVARLVTAIQTWDSYCTNADRRWLQPLVDTIFPDRDPSNDGALVRGMPAVLCQPSLKGAAVRNRLSVVLGGATLEASLSRAAQRLRSKMRKQSAHKL